MARRTLASLSLVALIASVPVPVDAGTPTWGPVTVLIPRRPLEIAHPKPGLGNVNGFPIAVLFDTIPEFQLVLVDTRGIVPAATAQTIVANGSVFALGGTSQTSAGAWGGPFIDNFEFRFWRSLLPHTAIQNILIDGADTWVDSSGASAGSDFYVSGVDFDTDTIRIFSSSDNGATWTPIRTITPGQPLYINFFGGERASFWVDPDGSDPATIRNCVFFETITASTTTKRVNCADGPNQVFDVPLFVDTPNPMGQADNRIENTMIAIAGGGAVGGLTVRLDQSLRLLRINPNGTSNQINAGPAPATTEFFSIAVGESGPERVDAVVPTQSGDASDHLAWLLDMMAIQEIPGPGAEIGPMAMPPPLEELQSGRLALILFADAFQPDGIPGLAFSEYPASFFADGFESGDTSGWSSTTP